MRVMGIDGGVTGAIAIYDSADCLISVIDTPTLTVSIGGKQRRELDGALFRRFCAANSSAHYLGGASVSSILFEKGQGVQGQSASAAYSYGFTNGRMVGIAEALEIPHALIEPAIWKRAMRLVGKTKDDSRKLACQLFPKHSEAFARKGDHGRAEAALIAYYAVHKGV